MSRYETAAQRIRNLVYPVLFTANPAERLRARLSHGALSQQVTLQYSSATKNYMWLPINGELLWLRVPIVKYTSGFWGLEEAHVYRLLDGVPDTDAGITYTPAGNWTHGASAAALNGTQSFPDGNPGRYCEFTVTGTRRLYIAAYKDLYMGYGAVLINGATTLVDGADMVTVGAYKAFNMYSAAGVSNTWFEVAKSLDPTVTYTVRLSWISNVPPGSTGANLIWNGYGVPCAKYTDANLTLTHDTVQLTKLTSGNNWGYAYTIKPTGAAAGENSGGAHNDEVISTVSWLDQDDNDVTVSAGNLTETADMIKLLQVGKTRHTETGATDIADVITDMFFNWQGIRQTVQHTWLVAGSMVGGYIGMIPATASLTKGYIAGDGYAVYTLNANDDSVLGQLPSRSAMLYDVTLPYILYAYVPNANSLDQWLYAGYKTHFVDYIAGPVNKLYFQRWSAATPKAWGIGDVWSSEFWYGIASKPNFIP